MKITNQLMMESMEYLRYLSLRLRKGILTGFVPESYREKIQTNRRINSAEVVLVSFPKCGRTWLRTLIGKTFQQFCPRIPDRKIPHIEEHYVYHSFFPHFWVTHNNPSRHLSDPNWTKTTRERFRNKKIIYLARDPLDVLTSYYHQMAKRHSHFNGAIEDFIGNPDDSINKIITFYNQWSQLLPQFSCSCVITYEELQNDTQTVLKDTLDFLNFTSYDKAVLNNSVEYARFQKMKKREKKGNTKTGILKPENPEDPDSFKVRKGKIGNYREEIPDQYLEKLKNKLDKELDSYYDRFTFPSLDN